MQEKIERLEADVLKELYTLQGDVRVLATSVKALESRIQALEQEFKKLFTDQAENKLSLAKIGTILFLIGTAVSTFASQIWSAVSKLGKG